MSRRSHSLDSLIVPVLTVKQVLVASDYVYSKLCYCTIIVLYIKNKSLVAKQIMQTKLLINSLVFLAQRPIETRKPLKVKNSHCFT